MNPPRHNYLHRLALVTAFFFFSSASSSETEVYFAGLSYVGDYQNMESAAPFVATVINDINKLSTYNGRLRRILDQHKHNDVKFLYGLGNHRSGNSLSLSIAVLEEQYQAEFLKRQDGEDYYSVKVTIFSQIVLFDFTERKVISTIPFIYSYIDTPSEIKEGYKKEIFKKLYYGGADDNENLYFIGNFIERLSDVNYQKPFNNWNIKVRSVEYKPLAIEYLDKFDSDKDSFSTRVANQFSTSLSENLNLPVLPYSKGQTIGNAMAMRFEDAGAVNLELPEANYTIDLKVNGFAKKVMRETDYVISTSYISSLSVKISDSDFGEDLYDEKIQLGQVVTNPKSLEADEWNNWKNTLTILADQFTDVLRNPDKKWIKEKIRTEKSYRKIKKLHEELEKDVFRKLR